MQTLEETPWSALESVRAVFLGEESWREVLVVRSLVVFSCFFFFFGGGEREGLGFYV